MIHKRSTALERSVNRLLEGVQKATISIRFNQVPQLTQDTTWESWESDKTQEKLFPGLNGLF